MSGTPTATKVLALGVYLVDAPSNAEAIAAELASARQCRLEQHWVALGPGRPPAALTAVTRYRCRERSSKFELLNRLLDGVTLDDFDFVIAIDDDIDLPERFVDTLIQHQIRYDLALAQPARTHDSYIDHHFTAQLTGIDARRTRFVEIGPVTSFRADAAALLMPFDTRAPMGWGLDFVWPLQLEAAGLALGIIDATTVRHALRAPASRYDYQETAEEMEGFLASSSHLPRPDAFLSLQTYTGLERDEQDAIDTRDTRSQPELSALFCSYNRAELLRLALDAICRQTLNRKRFELILVDDGSSDSTREVAAVFSQHLPLLYVRQRQAGIASARNHALSLARGEIACFLDDDDIADARCLEEHLWYHERYPDPQYAILGRTELTEEVARSPLMHFVTQVGHNLFSYPLIEHGAKLGFPYFWGGRTSCKRMFLLENGIFNPVFCFGAEDIELGYRLSQAGLQVVYNSRALSHMIRSFSYDEYCRRSYQQGIANWTFRRLHPSPEIDQWCQTDTLADDWAEVKSRYGNILKIGRDLDRFAQQRVRAELDLDGVSLQLLHRAYHAAFQAARIKGSLDGSRGAAPANAQDLGQDRYMTLSAATG